jgi:catechol-2,3-dioxygenase
VRITGMNHAVLYVRDARRHADWYQQVLGFKPVVLDPGGRYAFMRAPLSENHHDIAFFSIGAAASGPVRDAVGLYHLAWEVPTLADLDDAKRRLEAEGALVGASDHGVNKSLYARDPDGLEFEVMWLVPPDRWGEEEHQAIVRPLDIAGDRRRFADLEGAEQAGRAEQPEQADDLEEAR